MSHWTKVQYAKLINQRSGWDSFRGVFGMTKKASPELLLIISMLEAFRAMQGDEWCRDNLVGRMRQTLSRSFPAGVVELDSSQTVDVVNFMGAQREASELLTRLCEACGGCELASLKSVMR
jgi:hypothetical protein